MVIQAIQHLFYSLKVTYRFHAAYAMEGESAGVRKVRCGGWKDIKQEVWQGIGLGFGKSFTYLSLPMLNPFAPGSSLSGKAPKKGPWGLLDMFVSRFSVNQLMGRWIERLLFP